MSTTVNQDDLTKALVAQILTAKAQVEANTSMILGMVAEVKRQKDFLNQMAARIDALIEAYTSRRTLTDEETEKSPMVN